MKYQTTIQPNINNDNLIYAVANNKLNESDHSIVHYGAVQADLTIIQFLAGYCQSMLYTDCSEGSFKN
jgi:hypothetical protein